MTALTAGFDRVPGTAWYVDPAAHQVVLSVTDGASGARLDALLATARQAGSAVRVERLADTLTDYIAGGDSIYTGASRCSLGFNVRKGAGTYFFLIAGHCTNIGSTWMLGTGTVIGSRTGSSFPVNDYWIVRYTNTGIAHPGAGRLPPVNRPRPGRTGPEVRPGVRDQGEAVRLRSGLRHHR